jgi:hypothetical protein
MSEHLCRPKYAPTARTLEKFDQPHPGQPKFDRDDPLFKEPRARKNRLLIYSSALRENDRDAQLFQTQTRLAERQLRKFFSRQPVLVPAALHKSKLMSVKEKGDIRADPFLPSSRFHCR